MGHPRFIVVFKKSAPQEKIEEIKTDIKETGGQVTHEYGAVLNGFAAEIEPSYFQQLTASSAQADSIIDYIEPDGKVTIQ